MVGRSVEQSALLVGWPSATIQRGSTIQEPVEAAITIQILQTGWPGNIIEDWSNL
jgi:hypothetical protein